VVSVIAVGNEANSGHHYRGVLSVNTPQNIELDVSENERGFLMALWANIATKVYISFRSPLGQTIDRVPIINRRSQIYRFNLEPTVINVDYLYTDPFTGEEVAVRDIYVKKIVEISKLSCVRTDTVLSVFSTIKNKSLFASDSKVYIVSNDKAFLSDFESYKELDTVLNNNILILLYDTIDKRSKYYKSYTDSITIFNKLSSDVLAKYIQKDLELNDVNARLLAEICNNDYSRILLEIDKIRAYSQATNDNHNLAFAQLVNNGVIFCESYDAIFDFTNAVLNRDYVNALRLLQVCRDSGEATLVMLSVLYTEFKQTLQVQSCNNTNIAKTTGLNNWQINKALAHKNKYRVSELVHAMKLLSSIVSDIKIGKIDEAIAVDFALSNIL